MKTQTHEPVAVLRDALNAQCPANEHALAAAAVLSDRLAMLKQSSSLFDAVSFSPEVEAMMAAQLTAAVN